MRRNLRQLIFWVSVGTLFLIFLDPHLAGTVWGDVLNHFGIFTHDVGNHLHLHKPHVGFTP